MKRLSDGNLKKRLCKNSGLFVQYLVTWAGQFISFTLRWKYKVIRIALSETLNIPVQPATSFSTKFGRDFKFFHLKTFSKSEDRNIVILPKKNRTMQILNDFRNFFVCVVPDTLDKQNDLNSCPIFPKNLNSCQSLVIFLLKTSFLTNINEKIVCKQYSHMFRH